MFIVGIGWISTLEILGNTTVLATMFKHCSKKNEVERRYKNWEDREEIWYIYINLFGVIYNNIVHIYLIFDF